MRTDLHIHSNFSDGSHSPEEIVSIAKNRNVGLISICDHGTVEAYERLSAACKNNGVACVLGLEISGMHGGEDFHVLAYNFDKDNGEMKSLINNDYKNFECNWIIFNMLKDFPRISLEDYKKFDYPKEKGGWKYIHYAVARGLVGNYGEGNEILFKKYSSPNHLSHEIEMHELCSAIKNAGGVPVLAHPGYVYERDPNSFAGFLRGMISCGIGGIECFYPSHSKEVINICADFCKRNDLRITGGNDCYGDFDKSEGFSIGAADITADMLDLKGIV